MVLFWTKLLRFLNIDDFNNFSKILTILKLKHFSTDVLLTTLDVLNTENLKTWRLNAVSVYKKYGIRKMKIEIEFNPKLPNLTSRVDKCVVKTDIVSGLDLVDGDIPKVFLKRKLLLKENETECTKNIGELITKYEVSDEQNRLLRKVFKKYYKEQTNKANSELMNDIN